MTSICRWPLPACCVLCFCIVFYPRNKFLQINDSTFFSAEYRLINLMTTKEDFLCQNNKPPGSSINYVVSKLAILTPSPLLVVFLLCKIGNFDPPLPSPLLRRHSLRKAPHPVLKQHYFQNQLSCMSLLFHPSAQFW